MQQLGLQKLYLGLQIMASAKDLKVAPITAQGANKLIKGCIIQIKLYPIASYIWVFLTINLSAMQFGPSINKKGTIRLVRIPNGYGFIENRMAFRKNFHAIEVRP